MKKIYLPGIALLLFLCSCSIFQKKKAIELNDQLAHCLDSIYSKELELGRTITIATTQTHDYTAVTASRENLEHYIDRKSTEIQAIENVAGSEQFKAAFLDLLVHEKQSARESIARIEQLNASSTAEEVQDALNQLVEKSKTGDNYLEKVKDAQKGYAQKNGFEIKENTPPKPQ